MMNICQKLKELRIANEETQEQIADILQCSSTVYNRYERGTRQIPIESLARLAIHYKVSLDYICGIEDDFGNKVYE